MGSITDVPGIMVGQAEDTVALTGISVVLALQGAVASVDVRGAAPGTRETDLLDPANLVQQVQAVALCGGSAFGLSAVSGVMQYLQEKKAGFATRDAIVPIVPAAVIYDLGLGSATNFPDHAMAYTACMSASQQVQEGNYGAGCGASIGKIMGITSAMKSGIGTDSMQITFSQPGSVSQYTVGAIVVTNAFGDVYNSEGRILGGACRHPDGNLLNTMQVLQNLDLATPPTTGTNTTLAVIATDCPLNKVAAKRLAMMAHDGMGRAIRPAHTMFDGDVIFALSTGGLPTTPQVDPLLITALGAAASSVLEAAIVRSVLQAQSAGGLPGSRRVL